MLCLYGVLFCSGGFVCLLECYQAGVAADPRRAPFCGQEAQAELGAALTTRACVAVQCRPQGSWDLSLPGDRIFSGDL